MLLHPKPHERTTLPQLLVFLRALLEEQQATGGEPEPSPLLTQASVVTPAEPTTQAAVSLRRRGRVASIIKRLPREEARWRFDGHGERSRRRLARLGVGPRMSSVTASSQPTASERGESASDLSNSLANSQNVAEQMREYNATADARV